MVLDNTLLDLSKVKVPVYNLATREDHIAPADSVLYGSQFFGGPVKYVLSGSGHIAGVVNPPSSGKYQYWTNDQIHDISLKDWMKGAQEHKGVVVAGTGARGSPNSIRKRFPPAASATMPIHRSRTRRARMCASARSVIRGN